jgi:hypothetical protein
MQSALAVADTALAAESTLTALAVNRIKCDKMPSRVCASVAERTLSHRLARRGRVLEKFGRAEAAHKPAQPVLLLAVAQADIFICSRAVTRRC